MDTYADDLAGLMDALDPRGAVMVGHSTGGGEVTRTIGRHGAARVAKAVLVGAIPPLMLRTVANPGALPLSAFDAIRAGVTAGRSQFYKDPSAFYGANREGSTVSQGVRDQFWMWSMQVGIKVFSETDLTEGLRRFDVPTLFTHGEDDRIMPIDASARIAVTLVPGAALTVYPGGPHGLTATDKDRFNADLLAFIRG